MPGMKITDEMVAKFREAQLRFYGRAVCNDEAKQLLDAALNVPTENVPYVSQEMVVAGEAIILNDFWKRYTPDWAQSAARESYRAMRKLEPQSSSNGVGPFLNKVGNVRYDHYRKGDFLGIDHSHRRKDD